MTTANDLSPFGRHAPKGLVAQLMRATRRRHRSWLGRRFGFVCRTAGIALLHGRPQDVDALGARMRLYPAHNVSEKNLLFTPHLFDPEERGLLASRITDGFTFVDVGANVGGYSLFVAALAGPKARILAVEPQPAIFERLAYNVGQNPFGSIKALQCAVADRDGDITMFLNPSNSGESSMRFVNLRGNGASVRVTARTLATILRDERINDIDALKVDVEGAEDLVLDPFFRAAGPNQWPRLLIVDNTASESSPLPHALRTIGYRQVLRTRSNDIFEHGDA